MMTDTDLLALFQQTQEAYRLCREATVIANAARTWADDAHEIAYALGKKARAHEAKLLDALRARA